MRREQLSNHWQAHARWPMHCPACRRHIGEGQVIEVAGWRTTCPPCAITERERFRSDADYRAGLLRWCNRATSAQLDRLLNCWLIRTDFDGALDYEHEVEQRWIRRHEREQALKALDF